MITPVYMVAERQVLCDELHGDTQPSIFHVAELI